MDRRTFLAGMGAVLLATPLAARAQQAGKVWRVGWLGDGTRSARETNTLAPLREGLRELGYVEGQNILIDARWSDGDATRLEQDAAELVRLKVDVIVTHGGVGGAAAKKATATIPIVVATASDMVGSGLVASLARPGGNVTGTNDQAGELANKNIDVITELLPGVQRVAVFWYRGNATSTRVAGALRAAAQRRGLRATPLAAATPRDVTRLIDTAVRDRARGLVIVLDSWTVNNRALIVRLAVGKGLPVFAASRLFVEAGALASYGADLPAVYRHAAVFVDKILKGAKPADLPVEQPTKFELVINIKTAKALGLKIPQSLLLRADEVIQ